MGPLSVLAERYRCDEEACLRRLLSDAQLTGAERSKAVLRATRWIEEIRRTYRPHAADLLSRFGLSSQEGLALMCLAEALLRIADPATADALIREKLGQTHWDEALSGSSSWAMNAAGWALTLTGKIVELDDPTRQSPGAVLGKLIARLGQPVIREALRHAMQWLADQFMMGSTIDEALKRAEESMKNGVRFSFDRLGEGARTAEDAAKYFQAYIDAVESIGAFNQGRKFPRPSGISVKLSALHPRYEMAQRERVLKELTPRLADICEMAARHNLPVTIDAEEADRLQLSLEVAAGLLGQLKAKEWNGLGFAVQAYQKRAPAVIDCLAGLARDVNRRIHVRLVKGAYWDTEIKRAQERGWDDFPVFTRKASTDISYQACARRMLAASDCIDPVFGTHNALTVSHVVALAGGRDGIEFQRLHGMGEDLHRLMHREGLNCCVYAPVGDHNVLLGYLVRRILENGANSSFVHRLLDRDIPVADLVADPAAVLSAEKEVRHPKIRRAPDLFIPERRNSIGLDLNDPYVTEPLLAAIDAAAPQADVSGTVSTKARFAEEWAAFASWSRQPVESRARCLDQLSDLLEQSRPVLMNLLIREAGKTVPDALAEVREAVDYCRYYAAEARKVFQDVLLPGPTGERNSLRYSGRGVFVCISPWNFPLAIFLGQIVAALVAGNCVIAKPAPQTPRIAAYTGKLLHEAGIPSGAFQLAFGGAEVGAELVAHVGVAGVAFTGSTQTARAINRSLAAKDGPIVPLIAETGGQNALIVDDSALPEQVVDDVITSAFRSSGQRCSALRVLCLAEPCAERILTMLKGAMLELRIGDPGRLETDIGPVIDAEAKWRLHEHIDRLKGEAKLIAATPFTQSVNGNFVQPQAWEIPSIEWLTGEVFGPILHVVRFRVDGLDEIVAAINATGYGLTAGIHSRIDRTVRKIERDLRIGNLYINRSIIGAAVGVQPFGGEGLSGTGPKAGGPNYLRRFAVERVTADNTTAAGGNAGLLAG